MRDEILNFVLSCEAAAGNKQLPEKIYEYQLAVKNVIQGKELSEEVLIYCDHVREFIAKLGGREDLASQFNLIRRKLKQTFALNSRLKGMTGKEGLALLEKNQNLQPNVATYNILIAKKDITSGQALELFEKMKAVEIKPSVVTYIVLIKREDMSLNKTFELLKEMEEAGISRNLIIWNILISRKDISLEKALELFEQMKTAGTNPNVVTYNYLIAKDGISFEQVKELLENMQQFGVTPNEGTIGTIRGSSVENGKSALIGLAQSLIDQAENRGANFAAQGVS